jgi:ribose transport system permease protein
MWTKAYTYELFLLAILAITSFALTIYMPVFATSANISQIFLATSIIGILSLSAVLVISAGAIDLSVGSLMALSVTLGFTLVPSNNLSVYSFLTTVLLSSALCGGINGFLVGYYRLPAFLVTLATLSLGRGISLAFMNGRAAYNILPEQIIWLGQGYLWRVVPVPVVVWLVCAITIYVILYHTKFGAHNLSLGDNATAAKKMGVPYAQHFIWLFALSGLFASFAGIRP